LKTIKNKPVVYASMISPSPINFVDLNESNPVTNLSERGNHINYQMFVASFYCFLHHNPSSDFIIDLDNVWRWMGFSQKKSRKKNTRTSIL
jgi:hypothetical protein